MLDLKRLASYTTTEDWQARPASGLSLNEDPLLYRGLHGRTTYYRPR